MSDDIPAPTEADDDAPNLSEGVLARTFADGFRTPLQTPRHTLLADEPADIGGTDEGPDPYALLAAALASCTTMTLQMYARRKGWPLDEARAQVTHTRIYAQHCESCATAEGKIDRLERTVELIGDLTDEQRQRLLKIADRCPVHQTLCSEIDVQTHLAA